MADRENLTCSTSTASHESCNPLDINGSHFDSEAYVSKLLKEKTLAELMDAEHEVVQQVRQLDSEMQTLVYENYAKFITATDTIRKMRSDFAQMEAEMDKLAQNVEKITSFSEKVCNSLQGRKQDIQKLVDTNVALESLQFILDLPKRLQSDMNRKDYKSAVNAYVQNVPVLKRYKHLPAFMGIDSECSAIIDQIKNQLRENFQQNLTSAKDLSQACTFLIQLGEDSETLSDQYLEFAKQHLSTDISKLRSQLQLKLKIVGTDKELNSNGAVKSPMKQQHRPSDAIASLPVDVLEFVDMASTGVITNLSLIVATYIDLFGKTPEQKRKTSLMACEILDELFQICEKRFLPETAETDSSLLVRALDRFYKRIQALTKLITPSYNGSPAPSDVGNNSLQMILKVSKEIVNCSLDHLKGQLQGFLTDIRGQLVAPKAFLTSGGIDGHNQHLSELLTKLEQGVVQNLKSSLANLLQLTAYDVNFATRKEFLEPLGLYVREGLIVSFFNHIACVCREFRESSAFAGGSKAFVTSSVILLLSKFCINLKSSTIGYMTDLCEQQFRICEDIRDSLTPSTLLCEEMQAEAQAMIDFYVELEGFFLSQLLSKSVEARDWSAGVEPRSVRAVIKRVIEDLTAIDTRVGQLYEEGNRKDRSSNSSRRTGGMYSLSSRLQVRSPNTPAHGQGLSVTTAGGPSDNTLLKKLWSEKIDYFASVNFTRVSVVTGIVKICLKTFLECIRLETFAKFGLQQVQVDTHYLQLYLWRFVSDENLVQHLLEEIMTSVALRCSEAVLMEPSVVELICERG